jgi:epoxyqueuosine reductase QueG
MSASLTTAGGNETSAIEEEIVANGKHEADNNSRQKAEAVSAHVEAENRSLYAQESLAYKEAELARLRTACKQLEYKLKHTVDEQSVEEERMRAQLQLLKDEIERLKLNEARAAQTQNLEYIKNVVFGYMMSKDAAVRANLGLAIMHILKFTRGERQRLQAMLSGSNPTTTNTTTANKSSVV